jgi:hypothetical protein
MKTHISLFLFLSILLLVSCEKEETPKPMPEDGYPTTYKVLSKNEWEVVNAAFQKINHDAGLELNRYGFANGEVLWNEFDTITKEFVITTIDSLLTSYGEYFGIPQGSVFNLENDIVITNPNLVPEMQVSLTTFFQIAEEFGSDILEGVKYRFYINQNRIHEKYSVGISLCFYFNPGTNKIQISGFWIPDALVPSSSIYTEEEAYNIARKEIIHQLGEDLDKIEKGTESVNIYKALVKIYNNENIEIRDCWRIGKLDIVWGTYPVSVFVDSQTGEIVSFSTK